MPAQCAASQPIATFCQDTVTPLPPAPDDRARLRAHGAAVAQAVLDTAGLPPDARRSAISAAASGTYLPNEETSA
jgi:hypothetical protein